MRKYVWQFPVNLPGGNYCVAAAEVPNSAAQIYDSLGVPLREFWVFKKLFKRKANADKCLDKIYSEQRSYNLTHTLVEKGLYSLN